MIKLTKDESFLAKIKIKGEFFSHTWRIVLIEVSYGYFMLYGIPRKHKHGAYLKIERCFCNVYEVPTMPPNIVDEVQRCYQAVSLEPNPSNRELETCSA